ncbi:hypothetical protein [Streptodolium elevatio]|uniref:Uncharacterized protein n=1 Tax=Streptodolium elevatio TaxID=3157996 RepID=A0ABV3DL97_9ACTN
MGKKKVAKAQRRREEARARALQVRFPGYVACSFAEAAALLGEDRASELRTFYGGELRKADVQLELQLRSGEFRVIDWSHPDEAYLWELPAYLEAWNTGMQDAVAEDAWEFFDDEDDLIAQLHEWHREGNLRIDRDGVIESEWACPVPGSGASGPTGA